MNKVGFRSMRWLAVLAPSLAVGLFEFLRHQWLGHALPGWLGVGWPGNVVSALVVAVVVYGFVRAFADMLQSSALEVARSREEAAVAAERQRIAREVHDHTAQALFYLAVELREVGALIGEGEGERARDELRVAEGHLKETHRRVRAVIADLKQQESGSEHFGEAVRHAAAELAERLGVRVTCEVEACPDFSGSTQRHLLAIVQEALTNAHRHGCMRQAAIRVRTVGEGVALEVSDDGSGFDPGVGPPEGCHGLAIMEERAQIVGGRLRLDSAPGRGTRVVVDMPRVTA